MEGKQFPNTWRRTRACRRCSQLKVKCVYESPEDQSCVRCSKSGIDCVISNEPNNERTRRALVESRRRARLARTKETTPHAASSEAASTKRIAELQKMVTAATAELRELQHAQRTANAAHIAASATMMPKCGMWDVSVFYSKSLVRAAIDAGVVTVEQAQAGHAFFRNKLCPWVAFRVTEEFDDPQQPILSLATMVCGACQSTSEGLDLDRLVEFLERAVAERIIMHGEMSIEIVKSLFLLCTFLHPKPFLREKLYFMGSVAMASELDLGNSVDVKSITGSTENTTDFADALERAQLYFSVYVSVIAANIFITSRLYTYLRRAVPDGTSTMDALFTSGTDLDRIYVYTARILIVGKERSDVLRTHLTVPQSARAVNNMREDYRRSVMEIFDSLKIFVDLHPELSTHMAIPSMCYYSMLCTLDEHIINYFVFGEGKVNHNDLFNISYDIAMAARKLVDNFVSISNSLAHFPKHLFFSPLHGLTCMLRLRLTLWTQREAIDLGVDIESEFDRVKKAWARLKERLYVATQMQDMLDGLEEFVKLKLDRGPEGSTLELRMVNGSYMTNIDILHAIIQKMVFPEDPAVAQDASNETHHDTPLSVSAATTTSDTTMATPAAAAANTTTAATTTSAKMLPLSSQMPLEQQTYIPAQHQVLGMPPFNQPDDIEGLLKGLFNEIPGFLE